VVHVGSTVVERHSSRASNGMSLGPAPVSVRQMRCQCVEVLGNADEPQDSRAIGVLTVCLFQAGPSLGEHVKCKVDVIKMDELPYVSRHLVQHLQDFRLTQRYG
jgi:hypothetical protein